MYTKIIRILAICSLTTVFNVTCMVPEELDVNQKLIQAASEGNLEGVQEALKEGADINYDDGEVQIGENLFMVGSAIFQATYKGNLNVAEFLIKEGASTKSPYFYKGGLLEAAISWKQLQVAEYLIDNNICKGFAFDYDITYDPEVVKFCLWHGIPFSKDIKTTIESIVVPNRRLIRSLSNEDLDFLDPQFKNEHGDNTEGKIKIKDIENLKQISSLLRKFALKVESFKNKSFKDIVKKVNSVQRTKIKELKLNIFPNVLEGIVADYYTLYPENIDEFFNISEDEVDQLIKTYSEELAYYKPSDFGTDACSIM